MADPAEQKLHELTKIASNMMSLSSLVWLIRLAVFVYGDYMAICAWFYAPEHINEEGNMSTYFWSCSHCVCALQQCCKCRVRFSFKDEKNYAIMLEPVQTEAEGAIRSKLYKKCKLFSNEYTTISSFWGNIIMWGHLCTQWVEKVKVNRCVYQEQSALLSPHEKNVKNLHWE